MVAVVKIPKNQAPPYEAYLRQALNKANSTARRALLRIHKSLSLKEVWPSEGVELTKGELCVAWADGRRHETFWSVGKAAEIECGDVIRFAQAQKGCSEICEQVIQVSMEESFLPDWSRIPAGIGGFAFSRAQRLVGEVWDGWEDGVLWVPKVLFYSNLSQTGACLTLAVEPGEKLGVLRERLVRDLAKLELELSRLSLHEMSVDKRGGRPASLPFPLATHKEITQEKVAWCERVEKARGVIRNGELDKVVLARCVEWGAPPDAEFDAFGTAHRLRKEYPTCRTFLIRRPDGSSFVGATPEILVSLERQQVEAVSLAGTARRGKTELEDKRLGDALVASAKDQHEHRLVTDAIRTSFEPVVEDLRIGTEPKLLKLQNVQHLETPIEATLDRTRGIMELISRLHPTPAVGGTPSLEAQKWLHENEELERGWYAGLVGWLSSDGDGLFAVAIRSALVRPEKAWSFAGAGLVVDSDPNLEWEETALKLQAMGQSLVVQSRSAIESALPRVAALGKVEVYD
tara:strand:- start:96 stop:1646 length:1551 start_codon:yes stop_codon:yes gene_type:complete